MRIWLQGEYGPPYQGEADVDENNDVHATVTTATALQVYVKAFPKGEAWVYRYSRSEPLPSCPAVIPSVQAVKAPVPDAPSSVAGPVPVRARAAGRRGKS